jgi:hypothetical protein
MQIRFGVKTRMHFCIENRAHLLVKIIANPWTICVKPLDTIENVRAYAHGTVMHSEDEAPYRDIRNYRVLTEGEARQWLSINAPQISVGAIIRRLQELNNGRSF